MSNAKPANPNKEAKLRQRNLCLQGIANARLNGREHPVALIADHWLYDKDPKHLFAYSLMHEEGVRPERIFTANTNIEVYRDLSEVLNIKNARNLYMMDYLRCKSPQIREAGGLDLVFPDVHGGFHTEGGAGEIVRYLMQHDELLACTVNRPTRFVFASCALGDLMWGQRRYEQLTGEKVKWSHLAVMWEVREALEAAAGLKFGIVQATIPLECLLYNKNMITYAFDVYRWPCKRKTVLPLYI